MRQRAVDTCRLLACAMGERLRAVLAEIQHSNAKGANGYTSKADLIKKVSVMCGHNRSWQQLRAVGGIDTILMGQRACVAGAHSRQ